MSTNSSHAGTQHVRALADRALISPDGISVKVATEALALRLRAQFHQVRYQQRLDSKTIYKLGDPGYNVSAYDSLETKIEPCGDSYILKFIPSMALLNEIEVYDNATGERITKENF